MPGNFHNIPPSVIATWPAPNYVDPVRRGWMPAFSCTLLGIATVLITGRFYLRARREAGDFGLDDLLLFIGWAVSVAFTAEAVIDSEWYGMDRHTWDVPPDEYVGAALTGWIAQVLFLTSTCATKASVFLFYRRMAKDSYSNGMLYAIWAALGFTAACFVSILITYCFICQPLNVYWLYYTGTYDKPYTCIDGNVLSVSVGVLSVMSDIFAVLLPTFWLQRYNLNISCGQRIGLNIIFSLGSIVAGCGIARTYYLWQINHSYDVSWTGFNLYAWSLLECHLAIIFACTPSLRAFFRRYLADTIRSNHVRFSWMKSPTEQMSSTTSGNRGDSIITDTERGMVDSPVEQRVLTKESHDFPRPPSFTDSTRSRSSETVPEIKTADDYEAFALKQLDRYQPGTYKRNVTMDRLSANSSTSVIEGNAEDKVRA